MGKAVISRGSIFYVTQKNIDYRYVFIKFFDNYGRAHYSDGTVVTIDAYGKFHYGNGSTAMVDIHGKTHYKKN